METELKKSLKILKANYKKYIGFRGVHYADIGYKYKDGKMLDEICLRLHVHQKHSRRFLKNDIIPKKIDGLNVDVIISNPKKCARNGMFYPQLTGGIEIHNTSLASSGTLGSIFHDGNNNLVGLSNYHVLYGDDAAANEGDAIIQPNENPPKDIIGSLSAIRNSKYDCAVFNLKTDRQCNIGAIDDFNGTITQLTDPSIPMSVKKSGVNSEITYGIIDGIGVPTFSFTIVNNPNRHNQGDIISDSGDSGSIWVLDDNSNEITAVGLLHQVNTPDLDRAFAFNIKKIFSLLNLTL